METLDVVLTPVQPAVQPALPVVPPSPPLLPDLASDLLEVALLDLEITEEDPNYLVNMDVWHRPSGIKCLVCFAGCVMAQTFKLSPKSTCWYENEPFSRQVRRKFLALDAFRKGNIWEGIYYSAEVDVRFRDSYNIGLRIKCELNQQGVQFCSYLGSPSCFKDWVRKVIVELLVPR